VRTFFRGLALVLSAVTFAIIACVVAVRFALGSHHINYMWIASTGIVGTVGSLLTFVTMRIKTMWRRKIRGRRNDEANSGRLTGTQ
jgi:hypothetical protein